MDYAPFTLVAIEAALKAGGILRQGFYTDYRVSSKPGIHNLVTEYDNAAEESIIGTVRAHFPNHSILAEESGEKRTAHPEDVTWVIDPLDGTVNFAHRIPIFAVSIGVAVKECVVAAVVYSPMQQELFVAERSKGAFLNGNRICISSVKEIMQAFMATGFPYNVNTNPRHCIDRFVDMQKMGIPIRRLGSAALDLAYVASGRYDAYWELNLSPWDIAAGSLLVEEAGGTITQYDGAPLDIFSDKTVLATNGHFHGAMMEHLCS
jgi:myo-inositol-1(or 4)-monophosphatase